MSIFRALAVICVLLPCAAGSQDSDVAPTDLEVFVSVPAVIIEREHLEGRILSTDSTIEVRIVQASNSLDASGQTMRGMRIDVRNNAWNDSVYLDEGRVEDLALQLHLMHQSLADVLAGDHQRSDELLTGNHTHGSQQCWLGYSDQRRILCPSYRSVEGFLTAYIQVNGSAESYFVDLEQLETLARVVQSGHQHLESDDPFGDEPTADAIVKSESSEPSNDKLTNGQQVPEPATFANPMPSDPAAEPGAPDSRFQFRYLLAGLIIVAVGAGLIRLRRRWSAE